jgi:phosphoglycolate phosphatase-like HAD superfamily hydrolase
VPVVNRRLYLFDIDGTLITSGGAGGKAMRAAFSALWEREREGFASIEFSGRSDYAIFRSALVQSGNASEDFEQDLRRFRRAYYRRLPASLKANSGVVLPGVVDLLDRLQLDNDATLAVGTGNFRAGARMKLKHYGLHDYFISGGYGDRTEDRAELIAQGIRAATRLAGKHDVTLVNGDTVHDITSAKANNAIAIGVLTGTTAQKTLEDAGADLILPTLENAYETLSRLD